jgi:hypothetical protein
MARQRGVIKLEGTLDDITFLKTSDGYMAKVKSSVSADRIATDPDYARTRENNAEFGRAGKAGQLLRSALRTEVKKVSDSRMISRLTQQMMAVLHADTTSARGERNVVDGDLQLVEGFEFNEKGTLGTSLATPYTTTIDRPSGDCKVDIPAFVPANVLSAPSGSTHFRIFTAAAEVDFENGTFTVDSKESEVLPIDYTATQAINLVSTVSQAGTLPVFVVLGVEYFQELNAAQYPLKNGAFTAMAVIKVSGK